MNTDACNVDDINILHITECLSLSFVASFDDWSNIMRTRSFTLYKNDLDFNDISDSASMSESILSCSTMNLSVCRANKTGLPVLTSIISSENSSSSSSLWLWQTNWWESDYEYSPQRWYDHWLHGVTRYLVANYSFAEWVSARIEFKIFIVNISVTADGSLLSPTGGVNTTPQNDTFSRCNSFRP